MLKIPASPACVGPSRAFPFRPLLALGFLLAALSGMTATPLSAAREPLGTPHIYKKLPDRDLRLYVVTPEGWTAADRRPAIVFYHGGGWVKGTPAVLNDQAAHCATLGLVAVLAEYRLLTGPAETPEVCIRDAKSALRWVRAHAAELGIDPDRIAAGGGSAGAHLAASTALLSGFDEPGDDLDIPPKPNALVLFNPVIDNGPRGFGYKRFTKRHLEFSPAHNIVPGAPPTLIMSGTADTIARPVLLENYKAAMDAAGARCDLKLYEGGQHGFYRRSDHGGKFFRPTLDEMENFFRSLGWVPARK